MRLVGVSARQKSFEAIWSFVAWEFHKGSYGEAMPYLMIRNKCKIPFELLLNGGLINELDEPEKQHEYSSDSF
jgi:hypothetical protein